MVTNWFYFCAGILFLALAKIKHTIHGYSSPKPFSIDETKRCIEYDIGVVESWLTQLRQYTSTHDEHTLAPRQAKSKSIWREEA